MTLDELVDAVGVDAARYTLARYPADSPMTLDIELVTRQTSDNPVFYVQYAHARICSVIRQFAEGGGDESSLANICGAAINSASGAASGRPPSGKARSR